MNVRQFSIEAYTEVSRGAAWQDLLAQLNLRSDSSVRGLEAFASASLRSEPEGMALARLTAGSQTLSPIPQRARLPIALVPLDEDIEVEVGSETVWIPPGTLAVLPMDREWRLPLEKCVRLVVLSISDTLLQGRKPGSIPFTAPRRYAPQGLAAIFIRSLEIASAEMEELSPAEWRALEQSFADLFLTLLVEAETGDPASSPSLAALFNRATLAVERRLHDPHLTSTRIARVEGISERYLQKLFEQNGESFNHYLRERRLQRARGVLVAEKRTPVADVAYSCGFVDAANFNRMFKERFHLPPGAFRSRYLETAAESVSAEQRGWPIEALSNRKHQRGSTAFDASVSNSGQTETPRKGATLHRVVVSASTVHWGFFSRSLSPILHIDSGDSVDVETLSQHATDDPDLMIRGDAAAEDVFLWTPNRKNVDRRGAGPLDASIFGRGAGEGFGVHICTGPIFVRDAEPGDVVEVRIDDIAPRASRSPSHQGRVFGSNLAAWWGYHYGELIEEPRPRETVTVFEIFADADEPFAEALYSYRWAPQVDPYGIVHRIYDYPGVPVDPRRVEIRQRPLSGVRVPLRLHFGVIALAPREAGRVDSVPPAYFGGNIDNWRLGKGAAVYLPVSVPGALLSIGDPHAAQGDGEISGTAIECSMTGRFTIVLHKKGSGFADVTYPLIETPEAWVLTGLSHPNYLAEFGVKGPGEVYVKSSLDLAMQDAFHKARRFLMETRGLAEDEAIAVLSAAVDFSVTQVADGNWGVHAIIRKALFR